MHVKPLSNLSDPMDKYVTSRSGTNTVLVAYNYRLADHTIYLATITEERKKVKNIFLRQQDSYAWNGDKLKLLIVSAAYLRVYAFNPKPVTNSCIETYPRTYSFCYGVVNRLQVTYVTFFFKTSTALLREF